MHNKQKLVIKVTKTLRTDQNTLRILIITSIVAVIISIFLEYFGKSLICWQIRKMIHIDYLINLMLGIAASAFISFVGLVFPYMHRKNERITEIKTMLRNIYFHYREIILLTTFKTGTLNQKYIYSVKYYSEDKFIEMVTHLENEINEESALYEKSELESEDFRNINEVLKKEVMTNILAISSFCSFLFSLNESKTYIPDNIPKNMSTMSFVDKDTAIALAEEECYSMLFNMINENFSYNKLQDLYRPLLNASEIKKDTFIRESNSQKTFESDNSLFNNRIHCEIIEIVTKYRIALLDEIMKLNSRRKNIEEKFREKNISDPLFLEKLNKVKTLIDKKEIEKYRVYIEVLQLLDALEKDAENYDTENNSTNS